MKVINEILFIMLATATLMLGIAAHGYGCERMHDGCTPTEQRCNNGDVQECNGDREWYVVDHCDQVNPVEWGWRCCYLETEDLFACLPEAECPDGTQGGK